MNRPPHFESMILPAWRAMAAQARERANQPTWETIRGELHRPAPMTDEQVRGWEGVFGVKLDVHVTKPVLKSMRGAGVSDSRAGTHRRMEGTRGISPSESAQRSFWPDADCSCWDAAEAGDSCSPVSADAEEGDSAYIDEANDRVTSSGTYESTGGQCCQSYKCTNYEGRCSGLPTSDGGVGGNAVCGAEHGYTSSNRIRYIYHAGSSDPHAACGVAGYCVAQYECADGAWVEVADTRGIQCAAPTGESSREVTMCEGPCPEGVGVPGRGAGFAVNPNGVDPSWLQWALSGAAIGAATGAGVLAVVDGPLPIADVIGAGGGATLGGLIALGVYAAVRPRLSDDDCIALFLECVDADGKNLPGRYCTACLHYCTTTGEWNCF